MRSPQRNFSRHYSATEVNRCCFDWVFGSKLQKKIDTLLIDMLLYLFGNVPVHCNVFLLFFVTTFQTTLTVNSHRIEETFQLKRVVAKRYEILYHLYGSRL